MKRTGVAAGIMGADGNAVAVGPPAWRSHGSHSVSPRSAGMKENDVASANHMAQYASAKSAFSSYDGDLRAGDACAGGGRTAGHFCNQSAAAPGGEEASPHGDRAADSRGASTSGGFGGFPGFGPRHPLQGTEQRANQDAPPFEGSWGFGFGVGGSTPKSHHTPSVRSQKRLHSHTPQQLFSTPMSAPAQQGHDFTPAVHHDGTRAAGRPLQPPAPRKTPPLAPGGAEGAVLDPLGWGLSVGGAGLFGQALATAPPASFLFDDPEASQSSQGSPEPTRKRLEDFLTDTLTPKKSQRRAKEVSGAMERMDREDAMELLMRMDLGGARAEEPPQAPPEVPDYEDYGVGGRLQDLSKVLETPAAYVDNAVLYQQQAPDTAAYRAAGYGVESRAGVEGIEESPGESPLEEGDSAEDMSMSGGKGGAGGAGGEGEGGAVDRDHPPCFTDQVLSRGTALQCMPQRPRGRALAGLQF